MTDHRAQPVSVLHLAKGLGPGGAEQLLVEQASKRDRERFHYEVAYVVPEKSHLVPILADHDVDATCLTGPNESATGWLRRLRPLLEDHDVVHAHSPLLAAAARGISRTIPRSGRPIVLSTEHNRWPRHNRYTRLVNRATLRLDAHPLAVSDDVARTMTGRDDVEVLVHGIDVAQTAALSDGARAVRAEFGIGDEEVVLGTVANFRPEKAYDVMLGAAAKVIQRHPEARFLLVGQGPLEAEMRRLHESLGLGDRVILTGYRPDATQITAAFDIFTMSSLHEGLPVSLMDALALGCPVAATRAGGIPQAVTDGQEGLLVEPGDVDALVEAQSRLVGDAALRGTMALAARARAGQFDSARTTERLETIYRTLVQSRS